MNVAPAHIYRSGFGYRIFGCTVGTIMIALGLFMFVAITLPLPGIVLHPPIWGGVTAGYSLGLVAIAFGLAMMVGIIKYGDA